MQDYVLLENVVKRYRSGEVVTTAADGVSFSVQEGEFAIIVGPSGAGKTTVLNVLGGMDTCDEGRIVVQDREVSAMTNKELSNYRRYDIGFVFQFYNLVQNLTAKENVELASQICPHPMEAKEALISVGLEKRIDNLPSHLSGGEQQRVAIARALAKRPKLLLCDEPTGALDYNTGRHILGLLQETCRKNHMTVVLVTHNQAIAPMADRVIRMKNGKVVTVETNASPLPVEEIEW